MKQKDVDALCNYESAEIEEQVRVGVDAAIARMIQGGMEESKLLASGLEEFIRELSAILDVTAWSVDRAAVRYRWNRRSIKLFAEIIGVGYLARKNYDEPPMEPREIQAHLLTLKLIVNSVTHCDAETAKRRPRRRK